MSYARSLPISGDGAVVAQLTATVESREDADRIAAILLEHHLVACVQIGGPVVSRYWWQGELTESTEYVLVAKTTAARADAAVTAVTEAHPYDVPEVVVTPVIGGNLAYLEWVAETVD